MFLPSARNSLHKLWMLRGQTDSDPNSDWATLPVDAGSDWTIAQRWERFTAVEHATWDRLFARQSAMLQGRAVAAFHEGLHLLDLSQPGIPRFEPLNERLHRATGWTVVPVPGRIPHEIFYRHLSERRFPVGNFIRKPDELDYLKTPDAFHDLFGHITLLAQPQWADLMQRMGQLGLAAEAAGNVMPFARLYWYTVEFGLCREDGELRIYGAGIVSSFTESQYALESQQPRRIRFDLQRVLRTQYRVNFLQQLYFVIDDFRDLGALLLRSDLECLYDTVEAMEVLQPTDRLPTDHDAGPADEVGVKRSSTSSVSRDPTSIKSDQGSVRSPDGVELTENIRIEH